MPHISTSVFPIHQARRRPAPHTAAHLRLSRCMNCSYAYTAKGYRIDTRLGKRPLITPCCRGWMVQCRDCGIQETVTGRDILKAVARWNLVMSRNPRPFRIAVTPPVHADDIPF